MRYDAPTERSHLRARANALAWWPWLALLCLALQVGWAAQAATFTASLDRDQITFGESATLSLTFTGGEPSGPPGIPEMRNVAVAYVGPSRQVNITQGVVSSTTTHLYTLHPRQPGNYTIPAIRATVGGQVLTSAPLPLAVLRPGTTPPGATNAATQLAFFRLSAPKTNIYLGEVMVVDLQLYVRQGVQGIQDFQLTDFPANGFNIGKMAQSERRQVQLGGVIYTVIPLSFPLTATKPGPVTIGPVVASVTVQVPARNRQRDPFFEQFGMRDPFDMFGRNEDRQVPLSSQEVRARILPLPQENVPNSFSGAVGEYQMTATVGPTNVAVGDPVTLRIQISGRGALETLTLPTQAAFKDFKIYPPTSKTETSDPMGLQGTRTFDQVIVPERTDLREVPAFEFSYFDPNQGAYRTLRHPQVGLIVRPGGSLPSLAAPSSAGQQETASTPGIVHIKPRLGTLAQVDVPLIRRGGFIALQLLPIGVLAFAFAWKVRNETLASNPRLRRRKQAEAAIQNGLRDLHGAAAQGANADFYAIVFRLLQERIGERLDVPSSAITEAVVEEQLRPRGVPDDLLLETSELFQSCNLARYASGATPEPLATTASRVERVLQRLGQLRV